MGLKKVDSRQAKKKFLMYETVDKLESLLFDDKQNN